MNSEFQMFNLNPSSVDRSADQNTKVMTGFISPISRPRTAPATTSSSSTAERLIPGLKEAIHNGDFSIIRKNKQYQTFRERIFDLNRASTRVGSYIPLKDNYLQDYFRIPSVQKHLKSLGLLDHYGRAVSEREFRKRHVMEEKIRREREVEESMARLEINRQIELAIRQVLEERIAIDKSMKWPGNAHMVPPGEPHATDNDPAHDDIVSAYPESMRKTVLLYTADRRKRLSQQKKSKTPVSPKAAKLKPQSPKAAKPKPAVSAVDQVVSPRTHRRQIAMADTEAESIKTPTSEQGESDPTFVSQRPASAKPIVKRTPMANAVHVNIKRTGRPESALPRPSTAKNAKKVSAREKSKPIQTTKPTRKESATKLKNKKSQSTSLELREDKELESVFGRDTDDLDGLESPFGELAQPAEDDQDLEELFGKDLSGATSEDIDDNWTGPSASVPRRLKRDEVEEDINDSVNGSMIEIPNVENDHSAILEALPVTAEDGTPLSPASAKRVTFGSAERLKQMAFTENYSITTSQDKLQNGPVKGILRNSGELLNGGSQTKLKTDSSNAIHAV